MENDNNYCVECDKAFSSESGLKRHITRIHAVNAPADITPPNPTSISGSKDVIGDRYRDMIIKYGMFVFMVNQADGKALIDGAPAAGQAMGRYCANHPSAKKIVKTIVDGNDLVDLIAAHAAIAMPIIQNHKPQSIPLPEVNHTLQQDFEFTPQ